MKKLSIIIPCYNDPIYLSESVTSAINQTYPNKEIIIVDDGSNGETKDVIESFRYRVSIIITQKNSGLSAARNVGIKEASGFYILVQDSDDFFDSHFCEKAIDLIEEDLENNKIVTCHAQLFNNKGNIKIYEPKGGAIENFLFSNSSIGNSLFLKSTWTEVEGYDLLMKSGYEDWEFYIRILKNGGRAVVIDEVLFYYRQKDISMRKEAYKIKYSIWQYVFKKHHKLYKIHYGQTIDFFLSSLQLEESTKIKRETGIDFKVGKKVLKPLRWLKKVLNL